MKRHLPVIEPHRFAARDFIGGDAAIDFVNTVTGRDQTPRDWLPDYTALLDWAARARLLPPKLLRGLAATAEADPAATAKALARAKAMREALFAVVAAIAAGQAPPKNALSLLREHWIAGAKSHELRLDAGRVVLELAGDAGDLDLVASAVAWRMVESVLAKPPEKLRICQGPNCSWLFIDNSKAGRRRWCDMAVCGNAAKSRRHYARERAKS